MTGRYTGTLSGILARVLDGSDYIVEVSGDAIKVVILSGTPQPPRSQAGSTSQAKEAVSAPVPVPTPSQTNTPPAPIPTAPPLASYLTMSQGPALTTP